MTSFGLETDAEDNFVGVNDRTDVRGRDKKKLLVCETSAIPELREAILCCLEAEKLWKHEGETIWRCIIAFSSSIGMENQLGRVRTLVHEVSPPGSALPITLYLTTRMDQWQCRPGTCWMLSNNAVNFIAGRSSAGGAFERTWSSLMGLFSRWL